MDTRTFAATQTGRLLERLASQVNATIRRRSSAEAIHHLRVAIRRFAQAVAVFKPCFPQKESRRIRRRLKAILALAGPVRDCDIALEVLAAHKETSLAVELRARRQRGGRALMATLKQWVARKSAARWGQALAAGEIPWPMEEMAQRELRRRAKPFFRQGNQVAGANAGPGELHKLRIAAKKLRYTLELFAELYGPAAGDWLERIRGAQSLLGGINDCRAVQSLMASLGGNAKVEAALRRKQRRKTRQFQRLWSEEFAGVAPRQWMHSLRRPPRKPVARNTSAATASPAAAASAAAAGKTA
jgi:CHAD domain-containing protein